MQNKLVSVRNCDALKTTECVQILRYWEDTVFLFELKMHDRAKKNICTHRSFEAAAVTANKKVSEQNNKVRLSINILIIGHSLLYSSYSYRPRLPRWLISYKFNFAHKKRLYPSDFLFLRRRKISHSYGGLESTPGPTFLLSINQPVPVQLISIQNAFSFASTISSVRPAFRNIWTG